MFQRCLLVMSILLLSGCSAKTRDILRNGKTPSIQALTVKLFDKIPDNCKDLGEVDMKIPWTGSDVKLKQWSSNYLRHAAAVEKQANAVVIERIVEGSIQTNNMGTTPFVEVYGGAYKCP